MTKLFMTILFLTIATCTWADDTIEFHGGQLALTANISNALGIGGLYYLTPNIILAPGVYIADSANGQYTSTNNWYSTSNGMTFAAGLGSYYEFSPFRALFLDFGLVGNYQLVKNWYNYSPDTYNWNVSTNFAGIFKYMLTQSFGVVINYTGLYKFTYTTSSQMSGELSGTYSSQVFGPTVGSLGVVYYSL